MPFYAYPIYTPEVAYAAPYVAATIQPFLTGDERQLRDMLQVEAARQQYLAHVEEQRAQARRREALQRQAEYRQREALAALHRRNIARLNNFHSQQVRRRTFVTSGRNPFIVVQEEPSVGDCLGLDLAQLLGLHDEADYVKAEEVRRRQAAFDEGRKIAAAEEASKKAAFEQSKRAAIMERARRAQTAAAVERAKKVAAAKARDAAETDRFRRAAIYNARARFLAQLQALRDQAQLNADPSSEKAHEETKSLNVPTGTSCGPAHVPTPAQPTAADAPKPEISYSERVSRNRAARIIQSRWRSRSADRGAIESALATITVLRNRFEFLKRTFNPPEHLEFRADDVSSQPASFDPSNVSERLLYTASNVSVRAYTNELTKLLMLADGVPSAGNKKIREARRSFVKMVEDALEGVDKIVADVWERQSAQESRPASPEPTHDTEVESEAAQENKVDVFESSEVQSDVTVQPAPVASEVATESSTDDSLITTNPADLSAPAEAEVESAPVTVGEIHLSELITEAIEEEAAIDVQRSSETATSVEAPINGDSDSEASTYSSAKGEEGVEATPEEQASSPEETSLSTSVEVDVDAKSDSSQDIAPAPADYSTSPFPNVTSLSRTFQDELTVLTALDSTLESQPTSRPTSPLSEGYNIVYPDSPSQDVGLNPGEPSPESSGGGVIFQEREESSSDSIVVAVEEEKAADEEEEEEEYDIV